MPGSEQEERIKKREKEDEKDRTKIGKQIYEEEKVNEDKRKKEQMKIVRVNEEQPERGENERR